ncbi:MAG: YgjV family protein [Gammaproteobacteria bacterium]|nr:YgjV family protein [Gammaproteobacteria bacterium]
MLPIIAACFGTYAIFFLSGIKMRIAFMCGAACWIINNAYIGSIGGVLLEVMVLIANTVTIYRIRKDI